MRWSRRVVGCLLVIAMASCAKPDGDPASYPTEGDQAAEAVARFARTLAEQDRVNRYLHQEVVPQLTDCWAGLEGEGSVDVRVGYRIDGGRWVADASEIRYSTLASGQDELALRCLQNAAHATSFPRQPGDGEAREFSVNWSFPVPWPKDVEEVVARMMSSDTGGGGGGGCGGPEGPAPACWDCFYLPIFRISFCGRTCSGYTNCKMIPGGCQMGPIEPRCVTASPFGNVGGIVMY